MADPGSGLGHVCGVLTGKSGNFRKLEWSWKSHGKSKIGKKSQNFLIIHALKPISPLHFTKFCAFFANIKNCIIGLESPHFLSFSAKFEHEPWNINKRQ